MKRNAGRDAQVTFGLCLLLSSLLAAGAKPVSGWRGDGSGKYPSETPPVVWSRISLNMKGLRFSAAKSDDPGAGTPMPDGVIREWLIAGPAPVDEQSMPADGVPKEASLDPEAGQMLGSAVWTKVSVDTAYLDFMHLLGKPKEQDVAAFAFTHVYSPAGGNFRIDLTFAAKARLWVNGRNPKPMGARSSVMLEKGWNRLLIRAVPAEKDWYAVAIIHGQGICDYEQSGIVWRVPLPAALPGFYGGGMGVGSPVIVGERLYLQSEPHDVICLNKADGKVLWIRRASYFEAATAAENQNSAYCIVTQ